MSKVDWLKCEEFALSNLVKIACNYKRNNPELTTTEIGMFMKLNKNTISSYLKQGTKLGWCEYDSQKEALRIIKNNSIKSKERFSKPIICLNNGLLSNSNTNMVIEFQKLFNIKLNTSNVSSVCLGKIKQHKGYNFKYIEDLTQEEYIKYDIENKLKELREVC